jgi:L-iditol 2-dehydrogenase
MSEVATPRCTRTDDVRIRVNVAGLCRTDLYVAQGRIPVREPLILGHEFSGTVLEAGSAAPFAAGERITAIPLLACGSCSACAAGATCADPRFLGLDLDGAFADEIVLPARYVRKVPDALDPRHAAYSEPVAAALALLNAPLPKGGTGFVLGTGRIAMLTERILHNAGFQAVRRVGVDEAAGLSNQADFVVETEANERALQVMLDMLKPSGIAVLKSRPAMPVPMNLALAVKKDIRLYAVSYAPFEDAIDLIASGALALDDFLGDAYPLDGHDEAFAASADGASVKIFFAINAG